MGSAARHGQYRTGFPPHPGGASAEGALTIAIPSWMEELAPGAAAAARFIGGGALTRSQRRRLERLTNEATRRAWLEPLRPRQKNKKALSRPKLWAAHHELMWEAFRAPDFQPIGQKEIDRARVRLKQIGKIGEKFAKEIGDVGNDVQLEGLWVMYQKRRRGATLLGQPYETLASQATALRGLADFFSRTAAFYKPEGPVLPVGQPRDRDALKTTVIRQIAKVCKRHVGTPMYSTVARLANASLGRRDIDADTVRGAVRNPGVKSAR
jgi:hypothetical protein